MGRKLKLNIFRFNPEDPESNPHMDTFFLEEETSMTLYIALTKIREEQDPSLQVDFCCRAGVCGSCAMMINGRPNLACHTMTNCLPEEITLLPLPFFKLVGDLSVDTGTWFREINERIGSWIHSDKEFNPNAEEERMDNATADEIYELERCIECGCCVASCGSANMREDFMSAYAANRIGRFIIDPRDQREDKDYYQVVGNDDGIFGCIGMLACEDVCPKDIPLQDQLGLLRRKMAFHGLKRALRIAK